MAIGPDRPLAPLSERLDSSLHLRQSDIGDHHARADIDQRGSVLPPEQPAGAGHQRGASRKIVGAEGAVRNAPLSGAQLAAVGYHDGARDEGKPAARARKATRSAISSGLPSLRNGTSRVSMSSTACLFSASLRAHVPPSNRILPGATALMRIPSRARGGARPRTVAFSAAWPRNT